MNGQPVTLEIESVPDGITAEIEDGGTPAVRQISIRWNPERKKNSAQGGRENIRLRGKVQGCETILEVRLLLGE
jgi:hypothetical protein